MIAQFNRTRGYVPATEIVAFEPSELRIRADEYRIIACTTTDGALKDSYLALADAYETKADEIDQRRSAISAA